MKVRNTSLHKARMQAANGMLLTWFGRSWVPPGKPMLKLLPSPSGSTGLTELPAFPSWETPAAPLSRATLEHISMPLSSHRSRDHLCHPLTWGLSSWAKGHRQKLAEHRGYFGQGSSHFSGQVAEEPAREQHSQEQSPAWLCSPLELIPELTCPPASTWMSCLRATLSLEDREWSFLSCSRRLRDSVSFVPTKGSSLGTVQHHPPEKHPCHSGGTASHPGLAAAPSICSPKVSINS